MPVPQVHRGYKPLIRKQSFFIFVLLLLEMRCVGPGKWRQTALLSFVIKREAVDVNVKSSVGPQ